MNSLQFARRSGGVRLTAPTQRRSIGDVWLAHSTSPIQGREGARCAKLLLLGLKAVNLPPTVPKLHRAPISASARRLDGVLIVATFKLYGLPDAPLG